jgi:hypothetical protein
MTKCRPAGALGIALEYFYQKVAPLGLCDSSHINLMTPKKKSRRNDLFGRKKRGGLTTVPEGNVIKLRNWHIWKVPEGRPFGRALQKLNGHILVKIIDRLAVAASGSYR